MGCVGVSLLQGWEEPALVGCTLLLCWGPRAGLLCDPHSCGCQDISLAPYSHCTEPETWQWSALVSRCFTKLGMGAARHAGAHCC